MSTKIFRTLIFGICCFVLGYAAASCITPENVMEQFGIYASRIGFMKGIATQNEIEPAHRQVLTLQIERDRKNTAESTAENTAESTAESTAENTAENITENPAVNIPESTPEYLTKSAQETTPIVHDIPQPVSPAEKISSEDRGHDAALSKSPDSAVISEKDVEYRQDVDFTQPLRDLSPALSPRLVKLALVIDDMGYAYNFAEKILRINLPVTWSINPDAKQSRKIANLAVEHGQPFLLQIPMQATVDKNGSSQYVIGVDTSEDKIVDYLAALSEKFPEAIGVNNRRGSKATADSQTMLRFMNAYSSTGWGFLDSHTIANTIASKVAADYDIPVVENCVFIDENLNLSMMKKKFSVALRTAEEQGSAIAICHAREAILPFLKYLSKNESGSVMFVTVDELWGEQRTYNQGGKR